MDGPKLFLSSDYSIPFKWKSNKNRKLWNKGSKNFNLAGNFQKRMKCAARLLDRPEYVLWTNQNLVAIL